MITAATVIPIINTLSQEELAKVVSYLEGRSTKPKKNSKKELAPEFSIENIRLKILEDNGTEVIYERNQTRKGN